MKYGTFKLFIYLLICKMWSSLRHLLILQWIKDTLLYSKWVLNTKFLSYLKIISSSNFKNGNLWPFPQTWSFSSILTHMEWQSVMHLYKPETWESPHFPTPSPLQSTIWTSHFSVFSPHYYCLTVSAFTILAWIVTIVAQPLLEPSSSLPPSSLSLPLQHEWFFFFSKLIPDDVLR